MSFGREADQAVVSDFSFRFRQQRQFGDLEPPSAPVADLTGQQLRLLVPFCMPLQRLTTSDRPKVAQTRHRFVGLVRLQLAIRGVYVGVSSRSGPFRGGFSTLFREMSLPAAISGGSRRGVCVFDTAISRFVGAALCARWRVGLSCPHFP